MSRRFLLLWWRTSSQSYLTDPSLWVIVLCKSHSENDALPSTWFPMELSLPFILTPGRRTAILRNSVLDHLQLCWQRNLQTMEMIKVKRQMCFRMSFLHGVYRTLWWTLLIWDETPRFGKWSTLDLGEDCLLLKCDLEAESHYTQICSMWSL